MADPIKVANSSSQLAGKALLTAEDEQVVSGLKRFERAPDVPFFVEEGSAVVPDLDADMLDGEHAADFHNASLLATGTIPGARFPATLPAVSGENVTNLNASNLTGVAPVTAFPEVDASVLASGTIPDARFPATLPAVSGANLTNLDASDLASGTIPDARFPATIPGVVYTLVKGFAFASGQANAAGGGDTRLTSYDVVIPAGLIGQPGDGLVLEGGLALAANTNAKTLKVALLGGGSPATVTVFTSSANVAGHIVAFRIVMRRRSATGGAITGASLVGAANQGATTTVLLNTGLGTIDWSIEQTIALYLAGASANDLLMTDFQVTLLKGAAGGTV